MNKQSLEIRAKFLEFFKNNGCSVVPSDSLIPTGDKTLLFTSAGMVQFKQYFLGHVKDSFTRAVSCQKCFRTSDIDQIGMTARHLTFFEMLGNFSFGNYFKEETIVWAWNFLTENMSLPKDKLYITVYKNDDETYGIWKKIIPSNRIIRMDEETNFWNMGDIGPCGPCSEILMDLGSEMGCNKPTCGPDCNCNRYLEIWNLVFTQFDRQHDGSFKNLPRKNIDTGMGLERLIAVANGKRNVFDIDLFVPIIETAAEFLKIKNDGKNIIRLRIIADHLRAAIFLISDGVLPSNEGRGYVLRRILRRVLRQGKLCGCRKLFMNELVPVVFKIMGPVYPELSSKLSNIQLIIKTEEEKFLGTLEVASRVLFNIIGSHKSKNINVIDGKVLFKLYDTYGFPYDLTKEIAFKNGLQVDEDGFKYEQKIAQEKSRATWRGLSGEDVTFYSALSRKIDDTLFIGYNNYLGKGEVLFLIKNGKEVDKLKTGDEGEVIFSHTSFYAKSGGQSSDKGKIINDVFEAIVEDVFKPVPNLFVHKVKVFKGSLKIGDVVSTVIDIERRKQIEKHHTATHILHKVLREVFGEHITQAGSLVTNTHLRFDFTHSSAINKEDLIKIERISNSIIRLNLKICIETMEIVEARNAGAIALFNGKYGNIVRTVFLKNESDNSNYSIELCAGTHVNRTGDIGILKIISEASISAGVRRIEAVAGIAAENYILNEELSITKIAKILNTSNEELVSRVQRYVADYKKLEKELNTLEVNSISSKIDSNIRKINEINGIKFLPILVDNADIKVLRCMSDQLKEKLESVVLLLASENNGKVSFIVVVTADYVQKGINADKIAKAFASEINGSSGGTHEFAQGGSKDLSRLSEVIKIAHQFIK